MKDIKQKIINILDDKLIPCYGGLDYETPDIQGKDVAAIEIVKLFTTPDVGFSLLDEETASEPIQNALYATSKLTIDQCNNMTEGILQYIKDAGFEIVKGNEAKQPNKADYNIN